MVTQAITAVIVSATVSASGGTQYQETAPASPREQKARVLPGGKASIPAGAPQAVQRMLEAGNRIVGKPYIYGGGHSSFKSSGYDCSGTVSYALWGGGLLKQPLASGPLMSWGRQGKGRWVTIYANPSHAYMEIAGVRLDTSSAGDPSGSKGPRFRKPLRSNRGYQERHPSGL